MKEIKLQRGMVTQVDDEDFNELNKYKWFGHKERNTTYAWRHRYLGVRQYRMVKMHQQIMGIKGGDHRDGNGLNNQKYNLRPCTSQQNSMNVRPRVGCSSRFKGVSYHKQNDRWRASLTLNGKMVSLGCYATEEETALIYNKKSAELFGEFARPNVI
jgi:hypothetical protein